MEYFYCISNGEYSDYGKEILSHTKKYTKKEFAIMFNEAVARKEKDISKYLCNKFGFELIYPVDCEIEINSEYDSEALIPLEEVKEDTDYYCTDDYK